MHALTRLPLWLGRRSHRQRLGLAIVAGLLSALGFAPFGLFPFLLAGLAFLVLLIDQAAAGPRPIRHAALYGWGFGFGQFLLGLHWIGYAFMVDAADHAWQLPFVALLFPGGLALFVALPMAAAARFWRAGVSRVLVFALAYGLSEWLRGHLFTGFPWNIAAYGWGASLGVMQSAAVFGAYGLSLLTALFGGALALLTEEKRWKLPVALAGLFAAFFIGGTIRLSLIPPANVAGVNLRLVQPNIPQAEKYRRNLILRNWERLVSLSMAPGPRPTIVLWPEAAPPFLIDPDSLAMEWIADLNARGSMLMTGAVRADESGAKPTYYNSLLIFAGARRLAAYDKAHLVPFGEYLPFEETLNQWGLQKLTGISGSFGRGAGPQTFTLPGVPAVGPLICYEILFPGAVVGDVRPGWIANVTDDSWFGPWAGPRQHLLVAQMRAIEEGLPVVRDANTGISAVIDPTGRITSRLGLNVGGVLDAKLPLALAPTPFALFGSAWFWGLWLCLLLITVVFYRRK